MVAEDRFAQGYIAGLKRQRRLKPYLNQVYLNGALMQPGHIRPNRKNMAGRSGMSPMEIDHGSNYEDQRSYNDRVSDKDSNGNMGGHRSHGAAIRQRSHLP